MKSARLSSKLLLGWLVVAMGTLGQSPRLYGDGDPNCPNCQQGTPRPNLAALPLPAVAPLELPHEHAEQSPIVDIAPVETPVPIIKLKVKAPACAAVGKEMEYRFKIENCSAADAHNVIVKTSLPASVRVIRASPQVHQKDPDLQWNLGTVPAYGCHDLVIVAVPIGLADIKSCTRVQFEYGQCVTTKVVAFAPEGSAEGKGAGVIPGPYGPGGQHEPGVGPGIGGGRGDFDVRILGPKSGSLGAGTSYKISVFNKSDRPIYKVGVLLEWHKDLEYINSSEKITGPPGLMAWPEGLIDQLAPGTSRSVDLILRAKVEGNLCVRASASASVSNNPNENKIVNAKDEQCTLFQRGIPGMTLEMFDREDPILKFGQTSYPIVIRNQGQDPITNVRIKVRVPDLLEMESVKSPVQYRSGLDPRREFWVDFEPLAQLNAGETQAYELYVKAKGQPGDARFHLEMTADQLDKGPGGATRWIIEEESTNVVPDEETRARIREISRQKKLVPGQVTSGK